MSKCFLFCFGIYLWSLLACQPAVTSKVVKTSALDLPEQRYAQPQKSNQPAGNQIEKSILAAIPKIKEHIRGEFTKNKLPGLAVALVHDGERIWSWSLGTKDLTTGDPITTDTVFRIGSITKIFTGLALLSLRDQGKLSLDAPVAKYLPEIEQVLYPTKDSPRITIRHLVTHTSGIPRVGRLDYVTNQHDLSPKEILDSLKDLKLEFAPGTKTQYSNLAMALAGLIVGRVSKSSLRDYVRDTIFQPLGMYSSYWNEKDIPPDRLATGYKETEGQYQAGRNWRMGAAKGMGGMYSTLSDMSRFLGFQMSAWPPGNDPEQGPIRRSTIRESHLIAGFAHPGQNGFGVNWAPTKDFQLGFALTHTGATSNYAATVLILPQHKLGMTILTNTGGEGARAATIISQMANKSLATILDSLPKPKIELDQELQKAVQETISLLANPDPDKIKKLFTKNFLAAIPIEKMINILSESGKSLGTCSSFKPLRLLEKYATQVMLDCENGRVEITIYLTSEAPHIIKGFAIGSVEKKSR
jgi:CubicO group peptidase (beta-lactamase class C family)